jgi:hypothetical protein
LKELSKKGTQKLKLFLPSTRQSKLCMNSNVVILLEMMRNVVSSLEVFKCRSVAWTRPEEYHARWKVRRKHFRECNAPAASGKSWAASKYTPSKEKKGKAHLTEALELFKSTGVLEPDARTEPTQEDPPEMTPQPPGWGNNSLLWAS